MVKLGPPLREMAFLARELAPAKTERLCLALSVWLLAAAPAWDSVSSLVAVEAVGLKERNEG